MNKYQTYGKYEKYEKYHKIIVRRTNKLALAIKKRRLELDNEIKPRHRRSRLFQIRVSWSDWAARGKDLLAAMWELADTAGGCVIRDYTPTGTRVAIVSMSGKAQIVMSRPVAAVVANQTALTQGI